MPNSALPTITLLCGLASAACASSGDAADPASPPVFSVVPSVAPLGGPVQEVTLPPSAPALIRGGPVPLSGHLEGRLGGVEFASDTSRNSGDFELWQGGGGYVSLTIAGEGAPSGAGMLLVGIMSSRLEAELDGGRWSSADAPSADPLGGVSVNSCSGPGIDNLSVELPSVHYEMEASADPERPAQMVLVVRATFGASPSDATESELSGTFHFGRPSTLPGSSIRLPDEVR